MQLITRRCCNRELNSSCIHGCDGLYCTTEGYVAYSSLDRSCSGYINKEVFSALLREETDVELPKNVEANK